MNALLIGPEFLLAVVGGRARRVHVLHRAVGTAEHDGTCLFALDFAKALLPNWVAANVAFPGNGAGEWRCTLLMVNE
jgi:hypothetical protein